MRSSRSATLISILVRGDGGHRAEFVALFRALFEAHGHNVIVTQLTLSQLFARGPIFSPMLEEHTGAFCLLAAARALLGRRSVALLFRPLEAALGNTARLAAKRTLLRAMRGVRAASVFTIIPFEAKSSIGLIADDWIYDPQLWDWHGAVPASDPAIADLVRARAAGRRTVVSIGAQGDFKGFDVLVAHWLSSPALREEMLFVTAGSHARCDPDLLARFVAAGGLLIDRFLSVAEIRALYAAADLIWACYAPDYNQASGIFGRGFQLGVPSVIRAGARLAEVADRIGYPVIAIPWDDVEGAVALLRAADLRPEPTLSDAGLLRAESLDKLFAALALPRKFDFPS